MFLMNLIKFMVKILYHFDIQSVFKFFCLLRDGLFITAFIEKKVYF